MDGCRDFQKINLFSICIHMVWKKDKSCWHFGGHVDIESFSCVKELGIELFRLVRDASHLMQPLDIGFYGPLKKSWYKHLRVHSKQQPDEKVKEQNSAWHYWHLQVPFMDFYKPFTVQKKFVPLVCSPLRDRICPIIDKTFVEIRRKGR